MLSRMKKNLFFAAVPLVLLCYLPSFTSTGRPSPRKDFPGRAILCAVPAPAAIGAIPFLRDPSAPNAPFVRRNVRSLTPAQIASIKKGIAAMKGLPVTDPTSWQYQAAIHGTLLTQNLPSWNSCEHGSNFFFSWHRMYLYFFERILRAKSGDPRLTLPYWDYQTNPVLAPAYTDPRPSNPLYDPTRNASINGGGALPAGIMVSLTNYMNTDIPYYTFNDDIQGPHGSVHVAIGGNMASVPTSALDPCFWLHHTNIDRLWQKWLGLCGGRANPTTDAAWMNQVYTFFDENGKPVTMRGSQIVNIAGSLHYIYDTPGLPTCPRVPPIWQAWRWSRIELLRMPAQRLALDKPLTTANFKNSESQGLRAFLKTRQNARFAPSKTTPKDQLFVELGDIKISQMPEGIVELYLDLPAGVRPNPASKYFVGVLDLFSLTSRHAHAMMANESQIRLNVTSTAEKLGLDPANLAQSNLSFFVRGNSVDKKEVLPKADISVGKIAFSVDQANN